MDSSSDTELLALFCVVGCQDDHPAVDEARDRYQSSQGDRRQGDFRDTSAASQAFQAEPHLSGFRRGLILLCLQTAMSGDCNLQPSTYFSRRLSHGTFVMYNAVLGVTYAVVGR